MPAFTDKTIRVDSADLATAIKIVDRSKLDGWAEARFVEELGEYKGGRTAEFTFRHLLVGLCLVAMSGRPMHLRGLVRTLNALTGSQKRKLDLPASVTERMVSRRWNVLADLVDPSEFSERNRARKADMTGEEWEIESGKRDARLRFVLDELLAASIPADARNAGCYAIDATGVPSWSRQVKSWKDKEIATDPDAAWRVHDSTRVPNGGTESIGAGARPKFGWKAWYGYWLHAVVRVPDMKVGKDGTISKGDVPSFIERIDVTSASTHMAEDAAVLVARMAASHDAHVAAGEMVDPPRADLVVDRAYSHGYEAFLEPVRALGFASHFDLRKEQLGRGLDVGGMLVIDGQPYSPAMPSYLHNIPRPRIPGATKTDISAWQALVDERAKYAIKLRGLSSRGDFDVSCPAARDFGAVRCPNKPESLLLPPKGRPLLSVAAIIGAGSPPEICAKQRLRIPAEQLPLWQPYQYGSEAWWASMSRRARVEGAFGQLKNEATQDLTRGAIRVMGLAKTALMCAFLAAASNLRLAARLSVCVPDEGPAKPVRKRGPRARTTRLQDKRDRILKAAAEKLTLAGGGPAPGSALADAPF